jgi:hypothetical protein
MLIEKYIKIKIIFLATIGISCNILSLYSQTAGFSPEYSSNPEYISELRNTVNYWLPATETFGLNILVWSYDRYIKNKEWARISLQTMRNNLKHGFVWDADGFETNQLFHPYSGALSFTAARSSGLGFWQALPYPFLGSLMWELFMETEYPSLNDFITTPMSGIVLGEVSYRVSNLVLSSGDGYNILREITAVVISPMNGFNRLVNGNKSRSPHYGKTTDYKIALSVGISGVFIDRRFSQRLPHLYLNYHMIYGNYAKIRKGYKPFDYFMTDVGASLSENNNIIAIFSSGMLLGENIISTSGTHGIIGLFKSFNFLNNRVYKISANSVGGGLLTRHIISDNCTWDNALILSGIVMGGVNSLYATEVGRDYNLGPGANGNFESSLNFNNIAKLYLRYNHYWIHPLSGARGNEYVDILMLGVSIISTLNQSLNFEFIEYDRWSRYSDYPDLQDNNFAIRAYYTLNFGQ